MSSTERVRPGGQPSTTQPIAGPWLSPKDVTVKTRPIVLPAISDSAFFPQTLEYYVPNLAKIQPF